ncbi:hypothetical protein MHEI_34090 [Mycobacterium heidelbergense]|nr:hypothetical protein MHEI_34090 [Mycobacterium heidelbergense]
MERYGAHFCMGAALACMEVSRSNTCRRYRSASSAVSFDRSTSFIGHDGYAEVGGVSRESVIKCGDCRAVSLRGV